MSKSALRAITPMALVVAVACGGEQRSPIAADIIAPEAREARLTVTPALEVSDFDEALLGRIHIEDIRLNLGDVRLLGADPRIPVGGMPLLDEGRVIEAFGDRAGLDIPFPSRFLDDEDLAVYVRIDRSPDLDEASVVVRARLYQEAVRGGSDSLTVDTTSATDPDGDPAKDPDDRVGATDPDGDPALPDDCEDATDPDGDPARPSDCSRRGLIQRGEFQPYVVVELRDDRTADLVAALHDQAATDVVVGIPASRWFTPEVIAQLDAELNARISTPVGDDTKTTTAPETIVVQTSAPGRTPGRVDDRPTDDYFLSDTGGLERLTVRR